VRPCEAFLEFDDGELDMILVEDQRPKKENGANNIPGPMYTPKWRVLSSEGFVDKRNLIHAVSP